jgi:hypothetical protein
MATLPKLSTFVLCVDNRGAEDLRLRQVYRRIADARSARAGLMRVVDESGDDYLYPTDYFVPISIRPSGRVRIQKLFTVGGRRVGRPTKNDAKKYTAEA